MRVSFEILLDFLEMKVLRENVPGNPMFISVEILAPYSDCVSEDTLYIGTLSEALSFDRQGKRLTFLCIRDRMADEIETPEIMDGIAILGQNCRIFDLFNTVQRIFSRIIQWQYALKASVCASRGIQDLLDLSEEIMGNHIDVMDSTFKLLAHTKNIPVVDRVANALDAKGYHDEDTIKRLKVNRRFEQFDTEDEIIISTDELISDYTTVKKVYHTQDTYSMVVVMLCCRIFSQGTIDLFRILVAEIEHYAKIVTMTEVSSPVAALAADILNGCNKSLGEIQDRASVVGIPFHGDYNIFVLRLGDIGNIPMNRIMMQITRSLVNARVFRYRCSIVVLNCDIKTETFKDVCLRKLRSISENMLSESAVVGISNTFQNLYELPLAYNQTVAAINIGQHLQARGTALYPGKEGKLNTFFFEDYSQYYVCYASKHFNPNLTYNSMRTRIIRFLKDYEERYHINYLEIVYTYLRCECRASVAAERLSLHRNTVNYHIERIESMLGISLDDPDTRIKIINGYMLDELENFSIPQDEFCPATFES